MKIAFLLISILTLSGACVTVGPKKDNLSVLLKAALPEDEKNPDYFGYGAWIPNSKGFTSELLKPFQSASNKIQPLGDISFFPVSDAIAITKKSIYILKWNKKNSRFNFKRTIEFSKINNVKIYKFGASRRITTEMNDSTSDTFFFYSRPPDAIFNLGKIDSYKTENAFKHIKRNTK